MTQRFRRMEAACAGVMLSVHAAPSRSEAFDLSTGNAPVEVVIATVVPVVYQFVSPDASDATLGSSM